MIDGKYIFMIHRVSTDKSCLLCLLETMDTQSGFTNTYVCVCACAGVPNIVLARHHTNQDQLHLFFRTELTGEQMMIELATNTKVFLWTGIIISTCAVGVLSYAFYR